MATIGQGRFLFAEFQLDAGQGIFLREGESVHLNSRAFDLLIYFVTNAQRVIPRAELLHAVWPDSPYDESLLNQQIFLLRRALTASRHGDRLIATVPGKGFQFTEPVTELAASSEDGSPRLLLHSAATAAPKAAPVPSPAPRRRDTFTDEPPVPAPVHRPLTVLEVEPEPAPEPAFAETEPVPVPAPTPRFVAEPDSAPEAVPVPAPRFADEPVPEPAAAVPAPVEDFRFETTPPEEDRPLFSTRSGRFESEKAASEGSSRRDSSGRPNRPGRIARSKKADRPVRTRRPARAESASRLIGSAGKDGSAGAVPADRPAGLPSRPRRPNPASGEPHGDAASGSGRRLPSITPIRILIGAGALAVIIGLAAIAWHLWHQPNFDSLTLLIADADNSTHDAQFDAALAPAIALDIQQSPRLTLVSESAVASAVTALQRPAVISLTPELARELCPRLHAQAYIASAISRVSSRFLLSLDVHGCADGAIIAQARGLADTANDVIPLLDRMSLDLRGQMGEPNSSVQRFSHALSTGNAVTLTGLRFYGEATRLGLTGHPADAQPFLQQTVQINPQFAQAWVDLASADAALGQTGAATAALQKAWDLRNGVDEQSRFAISAAYLSRVSGDIPALLANYRSWANLYPHNPVPLAELADLEIQSGHGELAIVPAHKALDLSPTNPAAYTTLARAQMRAGHMDDAAATAKLAISRHADDVALHGLLFQLAVLRHDTAAQDEQLSWALDHQAGPFLQIQQALLFFSQGQVKAAQAVFELVLAGYRSQGRGDNASRLESGLPRIEANLGLEEPALVRLEKLPDIDGSVDIPVAWAQVGETARAAALLKRELDANPTATFWQQDRGPQIRAAIALSQGKAGAAIEALKVAEPWDMRSFDLPSLRGRAFLAAKQPTLAEYEFLKILDHPGVEPLSLNYPLAQLGLARALAQQGKTTKAAFAYRTFLQDWQLADPDLPILRQARQEYAKLPKSDTEISK